MSNSTQTIITAKDFRALEKLLNGVQQLDEWVIRAVRQKLRSAQIVFGSDIPAQVITTGTRFRFEVDGRAPEERVLVSRCEDYPQGTAICLATARGVALLGHTEGAEIVVPMGDREERIYVNSVLFQPEANAEHVHLLNAESVRARSQQSAQIIDFQKRPAGAPFWDGNDPGPSAA